jgi:HD superfamily phosphohydrolase
MDALKYVDYILDNVHGYIALTSVESELEKLPVFRRLRGIKQLGATNWVFPGAEHTRYSHSLGVMHMADTMALKLGFSLEERQVLRVAGMLHDIGHYPLSHVGEGAYRRSYDQDGEQNETFATFRQKRLIDDDKQPSFITHTLMLKNDDRFHHETIGEKAIRGSGAIKDILNRRGISVDDVCAIITGDIQNERLIKFVQLLHSELDADRIDYLLRDTSSSGTAYGSSEINALIRRLEILRHPVYGVDIIGVNPKGVISADQFLINRYFTFAQVFRHKHVTIINRMCEEIIYWLIKNGVFPSVETLSLWINASDANDSFFNFTDAFFFSILRRFSETYPAAPPIIKHMAEMLNKYAAPDIAKPQDRHNVIISGASNRSIIEGMDERGVSELPGYYAVTEETFLTKHAAEADFIAAYDGVEVGLGLEEGLKRRLINGVAVIRGKNDVSLLYDDLTSVVKDLRRHRTAFFRIYDIR